MSHVRSGREESLCQLRARLEVGIGQAERGELIDGDEMFDDLRRLIAEHMQPKGSGT